MRTKPFEIQKYNFLIFEVETARRIWYHSEVFRWGSCVLADADHASCVVADSPPNHD